MWRGPRDAPGPFCVLRGDSSFASFAALTIAGKAKGGVPIGSRPFYLVNGHARTRTVDLCCVKAAL